MTIDLSEVGKTNEIYSDEDSKIIQRTLFEAEKRLCDLQNHATENTDNQIPALINEIHRYKVALAPHKKLSEDLLRNIFITCVGNIPARFPVQQETSKKKTIPGSHPCNSFYLRYVHPAGKSLYAQPSFGNMSPFNAHSTTQALLRALENG